MRPDLRTTDVSQSVALNRFRETRKFGLEKIFPIGNKSKINSIGRNKTLESMTFIKCNFNIEKSNFKIITSTRRRYLD